MSRLPEILLARRLVARAVVDDAVARASEARVSVVSTLGVKRGSLARAAADSLGLDVFPLRHVTPERHGVPFDVLRRRRAIPLGVVVVGGIRFAAVALADPTDEEGVSELAEHLRLPIRRSLADDDDVEFALGRIAAVGYDVDDFPTSLNLELPDARDTAVAIPRPVSFRQVVEPDLFDDDGDDGLDLVSDVEALASVVDDDAEASDEAAATRAVAIKGARTILVLSGGEALQIGDALRGVLPDVVLQHDLGSSDVLSPRPLDRVLFVEASDAPFPRGLLEGVTWQRKSIVVVSGDHELDGIKGVVRIEPKDGVGGLAEAVLRAAFLG